MFGLVFTESDCRGRHLWMLLCLTTPCSSRVTLKSLPSTMSNGFWRPPRRKLYSLFWQSVPVLQNLHGTEVLSGVWGEPPVFQFCPLSLFLALGTTGKSLAPSSLHLLFSYSYTLVGYPLK